MPRCHALARCVVLSPADLAGVPLVAYGGDTRIGGAWRRAMRGAGIRHEPELTTNSTRLALQLTAKEGGIAVVHPFLFGRAGVPGLVAVPFTPAISLRVRVIRNSERLRSQAGDALLQLVARVGAELGMRPASRSRTRR